MSRYELTDQQWKQLEQLLPPQKPKTGRPASDHRAIVNGILWILRSGAPWRDLPERYGPWATIASRFYRWRKAGIWERLFAAIQQQADATQQIDWQIHFVDSTVVRAHQHAAGAKKGDAATEALGRSQGGFSTKVHLRADGNSRLMTLVLTPGQAHEAPVFARLLQQGAIKRARRGRPKRCPGRLVADKGYNSHTIRALLRRRQIRCTIPWKRNAKQRGRFDAMIYRVRNRIERLINRLKQFRRTATRYEKRAVNYQTFWLIGAIFIYLRSTFANRP